MKKLLILALLSASWSAEAKDLCTLAQTILKPAKNNRCYDQMIAQTKNVDDRKWLLELRNRWSPPSNLQLNLIMGGFELYHGKSKVGKAQWVLMKPPVLYLNGKFFIGKKTFDQSITKMIHDLFNKSSTSSLLYQAVFPRAFADETPDATAEMIDIVTLYTLGDDSSPITATDYISQKKPRTTEDRLPYLSQDGKIRGNCTSTGVADLVWEHDLNTSNRQVLITQTGLQEFEISGIIGDQKLFVTYQPQNKSTPCLETVSIETDRKYCDPAWNVFLEDKDNASLKAKWMKSNVANLSCDFFRNQDLRQTNDTADVDKIINNILNSDEEKCRQYFLRKFTAHTRKDQIDIKLCSDDKCTRKVPVSEWQFEEYRNLLIHHGIKSNVKCSANTGCELPKEKEQEHLIPAQVKNIRKVRDMTETDKKDNFEQLLELSTVESAIKRFVEGSKLLGEVCQDAKLRQLAFTNHGILLTPKSTPLSR